MKKILVLILLIGASLSGEAKVKGRSKPVAQVNPAFRSELFALINATRKSSGFDSLKHTELSTALWHCKLPLTGFIPVITIDPVHPTGRLIVSAVSSDRSAAGHIKMLVTKGIPGFTMQDSDLDRTVKYVAVNETRRVVFTKRERHVQSVVTVIYNAHQQASIRLQIEAWQYR